MRSAIEMNIYNTIFTLHICNIMSSADVKMFFLLDPQSAVPLSVSKLLVSMLWVIAVGAAGLLLSLLISSEST